MKVFKSLDTLPLFNYKMLMKSGDLSHLIAEGELSTFKETKEQQVRVLLEAWQVIELELYDMNAKDPAYIDMLEEQRADYLRMTKAILQANTLNRLRYEATKLFLEADKESEPVDYDKIIVLLEERLHFQIDEHKMTARKFIHHIQNTVKNGKQKD